MRPPAAPGRHGTLTPHKLLSRSAHECATAFWQATSRKRTGIVSKQLLTLLRWEHRGQSHPRLCWANAFFPTKKEHNNCNIKLDLTTTFWCKSYEQLACIYSGAISPFSLWYFKQQKVANSCTCTIHERFCICGAGMRNVVAASLSNVELSFSTCPDGAVTAGFNWGSFFTW